ncbi:siroheme synthase CysG [Neptunicella marina]|uniref:Siroheme synthase n=1 Tax=Neptunicella marina TaxID=2125989 RepID=A0A8J6IVI0_9ALTE|nr:siroheme synthase CysG [Neptunicella marina]MBC3766243.1 uroporphyrinogen-III C-methyltransferase [Neptunicella marina]
MRFFPIFLNADHLHCLVVGGGEVAARKIELLLKTNAKVTVVTKQACDTVSGFAEQGKISLDLRAFSDSDIQQKQLIFVATDDHQLNRDIATLAKHHNIPVNVVDSTELCGFITPSIIDRDPLLVALSSSGTAPVLLRYLRQKLESWIPTHFSRLARFSDRFRDKVKTRFESVNQRRAFWEQVIEGPIGENVLAGREQQAEVLLNKLLQAPNDNQGCVYLVGAGPGDADLLTFKALRLMQQADLVVYDRLVSQEILELVRRDAEKIYVGKKASLHSVPQDEINQLLVDAAKQGKRVVRLKGGDPYIFGRGGEEVQTLVEQSIAFEVVPGITAATGASCYAGIPLTHRDHAQSVVFATGHLKDNTIDLDWQALVQNQQTLVFYMGLTGLNVISQKLIEHGMPASMPIALVQSATTAQQKVVTGTLETIVQRVEEAGITPPALIIVGTVVSLHDTLAPALPSNN